MAACPVSSSTPPGTEWEPDLHNRAQLQLPSATRRPKRSSASGLEASKRGAWKTACLSGASPGSRSRPVWIERFSPRRTGGQANVINGRAARAKAVAACDERALWEIRRKHLGRLVFGPVNNRVIEEVHTADRTPQRQDRAMDETEPTPEDINLTAEQIVAADTAMLLDLGGAEELAEMIATQTLGAGDTVADRTSSLDVDLNPATPE